MPGQRSLDGNRRRLRVSDLADHNDFRILPEQTPQPAGKVKVGAWPGLGLTDPFYNLFDWILNRDNLLAASTCLE